MRRISKDKCLNDTLMFASMLLFEATGGVLGDKVESKTPPSEEQIPFTEKLRLLTALQDSVLLKHKVDPKKDTSGLSEMRSMLNGSREDKRGANTFASVAANAATFTASTDDDEDGAALQ